MSDWTPPTSTEEHLYKLLWDLPGCGCGNPEDGWDLVWRVVKYFRDSKAHSDAQFAKHDNMFAALRDWADFPQKLEDILPDQGARQIIVGAIDAAGLIDHGSSFYSSWPTDKGKWFLWAVEQCGGMDTLEERMEMISYPHHGGECTKACWEIKEAAK